MRETRFVESLAALGKAVRRGQVNRVSSLGIGYVVEDGSDQVYSFEFEGENAPVEPGARISFVTEEGSRVIAAYALTP